MLPFAYLNTFNFPNKKALASLNKLFKQTFIYGLATVLPRMMSFLLVPLYTAVLPVAVYGELSLIFSWIVLFNVLLAYGMETAFFRFFSKEEDQAKVIATSVISLLVSSFGFFFLGFVFSDFLSGITGIKSEYIVYTLWILLLDALVIIPFAWLRANEKPVKYAVIKVANVAVNLGLNVFFLLLLPAFFTQESEGLTRAFLVKDYEIYYIFISMIIASGLSLLWLMPFYLKLRFTFDKALWKRMMRYAFPVLIAGIAFAVNETFDRILLEWLLPPEFSERAIGLYSACYKLAVFMTLFATAFRLGVEPFFFSQANTENAPETYAKITKYFVAFGALILLTVTVFADLLKVILIQNPEYWEAMKIVPLILLANFCLGIYHNLSVWYKVTDRTRFGAYISVVGAVLTLVANIILIPHISYMGSAIATVVAYGSMMWLSYYFGQKHYKIPYDLSKIGTYFVVSIVFSALSFYVFRGNYVVGIGLLVLFLAWMYRLEKTIIKQIFLRK